MNDIDTYAYHNNLITVHPGEKAFFAMITMVVCLTSQTTMLTPLIILAIMAGGIVIKAGIPTRVLFKLLAIPLSFLLISVLTIAFSISKDPLGFWLAYSMKGLTIGIRYPDLITAVNLFLRSIGAVSCLYFLALTTPLTELISILHCLKVPFIITELMVLIYRFIFVFLETATTIRRAQVSRSGYVTMKSSFRSMSRLFSALLGKVFIKSQELYDSMSARGYTGEIKVLNKKRPVNLRNYGIIIGLEIPLILLNLLWR
ncbi:cobalt ABC transporter, permease protein CbiQ [Desulfosporosinus orientis DSM 765]|uniref:Cobalt ABC transporter, permease protein CbiQ n=1 Tax=Desulfosporosinus orientis (strain ATCC 19365 / DSM 765 / NCIMB 8382 / VKM B-1628 / Singapore I) TaxID=768706 RepID=G7WC31_DESOD|nr:cobalt ECF transporter T component CbiQ [Desulfosporosinus orientis]AET70005.1 cobalt ABC transporter, permease protein CbiQ [Desulfosporosinus orientis DSM 765]